MTFIMTCRGHYFKGPQKFFGSHFLICEAILLISWYVGWNGLVEPQNLFWTNQRLQWPSPWTPPWSCPLASQLEYCETKTLRLVNGHYGCHFKGLNESDWIMPIAKIKDDTRIHHDHLLPKIVLVKELPSKYDCKSVNLFWFQILYYFSWEHFWFLWKTKESGMSSSLPWMSWKRRDGD